MKTSKILKVSFLLHLSGLTVGSYLKYKHVSGAAELLVFALFVSLIFMATAIYDVNESPNFNRSEKTMWTIGLILTNSIAGFFYLIAKRRTLASKFFKKPGLKLI